MPRKPIVAQGPLPTPAYAALARASAGLKCGAGIL
jgi:hypothetical protein